MKVDTNKVITELIELRYRKGYSGPSLVQYLKEKYDIQQSRAYDLIKEAQVQAGETYNQVNTDAIKQSILFMENLRQDALKGGNSKLALEIQKELNKVNQLYLERQEVKLTGSINVKGLFGFEEEEKEEDKNDKKDE
jgi:hypothetical protein